MVVADVHSLQILTQSLVDGINLLASGFIAQPSLVLPSLAVRRHRRRQATMRRLYCANMEDCSVASAHSCAVLPDASPSPIPTGSDVQTNQGEALKFDEVATCPSGPPSVRLSTYDLVRSALCHTLQKRFEIDFKQLQD